MRIIVIGMDNTGKTTLVNLLKDRLRYEVVHSLGPGKTKTEMIEHMRSALTKENVIIERFAFFEEMVYGEILRGKSEFDFEDDFYKEIKEKRPVFIYCRPSNEKIKNWQEREQMSGVIENNHLLTQKFDDLFNDHIRERFFGIKWDYEHGTLDQLLYILEKIKESYK